MTERLKVSTVCFHYNADGQRCRASCLEPASFCCPTHLHQYQHTPTTQLLHEAAQSILDCTRFTEEGLPYLACIQLSSWKRLCNALRALSFQGCHRDDELLTALVASIESIRGPWRALPSSLVPKGKPFERLVTRLFLEELAPFVRAAATPQFGMEPTESMHERGYLRLHGALLVRLAQVLKTTPDAILAVKQFTRDGGSGTLDRRFVRRLQRLDKLSAHQKKILLGTIDAFLSKVS